MYSFKSRVRYSEVGEDKKLSLNGIINYFQDCSTFQSEMLNNGVERLEELHRVWVLSSWQIVIERYPKLCEEIEIGTWPYYFKNFAGYRNFIMRDKGGKADCLRQQPLELSGHGYGTSDPGAGGY